MIVITKSAKNCSYTTSARRRACALLCCISNRWRWRGLSHSGLLRVELLEQGVTATLVLDAIRGLGVRVNDFLGCKEFEAGSFASRHGSAVEAVESICRGGTLATSPEREVQIGDSMLLNPSIPVFKLPAPDIRSPLSSLHAGKERKAGRWLGESVTSSEGARTAITTLNITSDIKDNEWY